MKALTCVVIGAGAVFGVKIQDYDHVWHLNDKIKSKLSLNLKWPSDLTLYLAKKGGNWLNATDPDVPKLKNGELPKGIDDIMSAANEMDPIYQVDDSAFNFPDERGGGRGDLHVLVYIPDQKITEAGKKPLHVARQRRWNVLNAVLDHHANVKTIDGKRSTGFSYVSYENVKDVMKATTYDQHHTTIANGNIDWLCDYLNVLTTAFSRVAEDTEATRLHFIAPVLVCVCALFDDDTTLLAEERVEGKRVHGHGRFEFVIRRGGKRVCIVEAKRDFSKQGAAQAFVGSEVLADVEGLSTVFNIVTNFYVWQFTRVTDYQVEFDKVTSANPLKASVHTIVAKIHAMLSDAGV